MKKNEKNSTAAKLTALATGSLLAGSLSIAPGDLSADSHELFGCAYMGSGSELRSELLAKNNPVDFYASASSESKAIEGECGEKGKKEEAKPKNEKAATPARTAAPAKAAAKEEKAAEGNCGGDKGKKAEAKEGKVKEGKCGEGKCGEGKCGEHMNKEEKKEDKKKEEPKRK